MAREQPEEEIEEEYEEEEAEEAPAPAPAKKPVAKKPMAAPAKAVPKTPAPQIQYVKIPVFESQAMQVMYDTLIAMDQKLAKLDADLELMKKYLPENQ